MSFEQEQPTQEQPGKLRKLPVKPPIAPAQKPVQQEKLMVIPEAAVNQLLTAIAQLKGLDWQTINPIMVFIQQNVKPLSPPTTP